MTHEEAKQLKSFKHRCTCGGYAGEMNEYARQNPRHPHRQWCAQRTAWEEWKAALENEKQ